MAKRFTDNEKWKDAWFMDLPSKYKLFWLYLLDECNHAGIWKVNFKVASFHIGEHLEYSEVKRIMKERITLLNDEKWYIKKFIKYQYKCDIQGLNPKNKAHLSTIKILNEYDIFKPLTSPLLGVKDKDKDKDIILVSEKQITLIDSIKEIESSINNKIFKNQILKDSSYIEITAMQTKSNVDTVKKYLTDFDNHLIRTSEQKNTLKDYKTHFTNWFNRQDIKKVVNNNPNPYESIL